MSAAWKTECARRMGRAASTLAIALRWARGPGWPIHSTLKPVDTWLSSIEILKCAMDRPMDPTRNLHRETRMPAVYLDLGAQCVNHGSFQSEWMKARSDKSKKRKQLASALIRTLDRNLGLLNQVQNEFAARRIPTFLMDGGFMEYARPLVYELISGGDDAAAIEHARYELRHFDTKLEMLRGTAGQPHVELVHKELRKVASDHVALLERAIRMATEAAKKYEKD